MAYGSSMRAKPVMVKKKNLPRKMERNQKLSKMVVKSYDTKNELSAKQVEALQKHSVHHTAAHIKKMVKLMVKGDSFRKAHMATMMKIGK